MLIEVTKKDESLLVVQSEDRGILQELNTFFSFDVEGARFMPSYRNGNWDGKVRLFAIRSQTLPYGLLEHLAEFSRTRGYELKIDPAIFPKYVPDRQELLDFVDSIPLSVRGQSVRPRDYQIEGFVRSIQSGRQLVLSSTGSGKSALIYLQIRWFLENIDPDQKIIVVVPTTSLVSQMKNDFADYSSTDDSFDADIDCHEIYSGKEKTAESRVFITTWQSAIRMDKEWFEQFGAVIVDECHQAKSASLTKILGNLRNAQYRIGTTGTIDNAQVNKLVLIGNLGPVYRVTSTKELMDAGTLAKLKIEALVLQYPDNLKKIVSKADYKSEIDFLVKYEPRNQFIANLALDQKDNTLILFNYVENHGKPLFELIRSKNKDPERKIFFVSGGVDAAERERIRKIFETEKNAIIVASMGVFSTGVNIRNLNSLIFASPTKSLIRVLQSIGRGLRVSDNGKHTTLFDLTDDLSWKKTKNYTLQHGVERIKIYDSEKFDYRMHVVPLNHP